MTTETERKHIIRDWNRKNRNTKLPDLTYEQVYGVGGPLEGKDRA